MRKERKCLAVLRTHLRSIPVSSLEIFTGRITKEDEMPKPLPTRQEAAEVWLMPVFMAKAGHEDDLQEALHSLQTLSRNDPGCLAYTVFSDGQRPGTFVLFEGWARKEDLEAHNEEDHVKKFVKGVDPLLAVPFAVTPLTPLT